MSRTTFPFRPFTLLTALLPAVSQAAARQPSTQAGDWDDATRGVIGLLDPLRGVLTAVLGLAGLVALCVAAYKMMTGEREAAVRLMWWFAGLAAGFVLMAALGGLAPRL